MTVESASYISQLDAALPAAGDQKSEGDDHFRLIKSVLKTQFPNFGTTAITTTAAEVNYLSGVTSAIQTQINSKAALASPALTGVPTAPTAAPGTNTTQLATTAFVAAVLPVDSATVAAASKATPVDADLVPLIDSAASNVLKKLTWANIKATLATWIGGGTIAGSFTTLTSSGNTTLGDASTDTLNVGNGGIVKDASGNVGIGGTSAGHKLDVQGTSAAVARFYQATAATNTDVYVNNVGSANSFLISRRSNGESWLYNSGADPFVFSTNSAERMRIDSSGNVYVGSGAVAPGAARVLASYNQSTTAGTSAQVAIATGTANSYAIAEVRESGHLFELSTGTGVTGGLFVTSNAGGITLRNGGTNALSIYASGDVLSVSGTGGLGYGTGAGGTVTQATSKSTAVTLNKPCGTITTTADALAANAVATFTFNNSLLTANDVVVFSLVSGASAGSYAIQKAFGATGSCGVTIRNVSAGSLSEALVISFAVLKVAIA